MHIAMTEFTASQNFSIQLFPVGSSTCVGYSEGETDYWIGEKSEGEIIAKLYKKLPDFHAIVSSETFTESKTGNETFSVKKAKHFKFDWAGGLSELRGKLTSVELQHRLSEWR